MNGSVLKEFHPAAEGKCDALGGSANEPKRGLAKWILTMCSIKTDPPASEKTKTAGGRELVSKKQSSVERVKL